MINKLDKTIIENELNNEGYTTPKTNIWSRILVNKDGERVAMINTFERYYTKDGKMYEWEGTSNFIKHIVNL